MIQLFLLFIGIFILWYFNSNQCVCIDTFSSGQIFNNNTLRVAVDDWVKNKQSAEKKYGDINTWDTSGVTDMSQMFKYATNFNGDISGWDTSNVTDMSSMFKKAASFSGDISGWNTSSVIKMSGMFYQAIIFNADISGWKTSNVTTMSDMFVSAINFNRDISGWDTSSVNNMSNMFNDATSFNNGKLKGQSNTFDWNTTSVINMSNMFKMATSFNGDISGWNTSSVTDMSGMFSEANNFNADISGWKTSGVTTMIYMFNDATSFNNGKPKGQSNTFDWNTSSVTDMSGMFSYTFIFNADISGWNTSSVKNMSYMFKKAASFSGDISGWNTSSVIKMSGMFNDATSFNGNLDCWDTSTAVAPVDYKDMFTGSKIGNSKNDPISSGCWSAVRSDKAICNDCEKYVCDGNTGNCEKSFNGSFTTKESCEKEGCLTKTQFQNKYCNDGGQNCESLSVSNSKCNHKILKDKDNNKLDNTENYCTTYNESGKTGDTKCIGLCRSDKCNRSSIETPFTSCRNHKDDCLSRYDDTNYSTTHRCVNNILGDACLNSTLPCTNIR